MNYGMEHMFATKVYHSLVSDYQVINNQIEKRIDEVDFQYVSKWGKTHLLSGFGKDVINSYLKLRKSEIKDFKQKESFDKNKPITKWERDNTLDC